MINDILADLESGMHTFSKGQKVNRATTIRQMYTRISSASRFHRIDLVRSATQPLTAIHAAVMKATMAP